MQKTAAPKGFDAELKRLGGAVYDEASGDEPVSWGGVRGLTSGFVGAAAGLGKNASSFGAFENAYFFVLDDAAEIAPDPAPGPVPGVVKAQKGEADVSQEPVCVAKYGRLSSEEIAQELQISPKDTPAQLQNRRRAFARDNHPDRAPGVWREEATLRMQTANLLIDQALKRLRDQQKI